MIGTDEYGVDRCSTSLVDALNVSADGCPNGCGSHGTCRLFGAGWACTCQDGWKGTACDIAMETNCNSGSDEDGGKHSSLLAFFITPSARGNLHTRC